MSPMRRVAEVAHRVPEVQDINITEIPRDPTDTNKMEQENEGWDIIPEPSQPIEEVLPSAVGQQTSVRDDTIGKPEIVVEHVPLLNGGPPTSREEHRTTIISTAATTTFVTTATIPRESLSLSSTPQVSSTGIEEGVPLHRPICLTEEDLHIICSICNIVDCMIHNPRHYYCMDCGQRLMGPHVCPNETEHSDPTRTQISTMTRRTQPTQIENRRTHISGALLAPFETSYYDLLTYDEAILSDQGITAGTQIVPGVWNVLHQIDYSSDPEEARIHFELTSPLRHIRGYE